MRESIRIVHKEDTIIPKRRVKDEVPTIKAKHHVSKKTMARNDNPSRKPGKCTKVDFELFTREIMASPGFHLLLSFSADIFLAPCVVFSFFFRIYIPPMAQRDLLLPLASPTTQENQVEQNERKR